MAPIRGSPTVSPDAVNAIRNLMALFRVSMRQKAIRPLIVNVNYWISVAPVLR